MLQDVQEDGTYSKHTQQRATCLYFERASTNLDGVGHSHAWVT